MRTAHPSVRAGSRARRRRGAATGSTKVPAGPLASTATPGGTGRYACQGTSPSSSEHSASASAAASPMRAIRAARRDRLIRGRQRVRQHQHHVAAGENPARLDRDRPPPLSRPARRLQQQLLREIGAARRHADQRYARQREGDDAHRQRASDAGQPGDAIVAERGVDQSRRQEHGGLRAGVGDRLQQTAGQRTAALELRRGRR